MGLRSPEARIPLPSIPTCGHPLLHSSVDEDLFPSLISVVGSARVQLKSEPGSSLLADAAAILLDEQNKRPCRKFLLTGKVFYSVQVPLGTSMPCLICLDFCTASPHPPA